MIYFNRFLGIFNYFYKVVIVGNYDILFDFKSYDFLWLNFIWIREEFEEIWK